MKQLAKEYRNSAQRLKERIDWLRCLQKSKTPEETKKIEERIAILTAEYYHLLKTASYLAGYYENPNASSCLKSRLNISIKNKYKEE